MMIVAPKPADLVDKGQRTFAQIEWLSLAIGLVTAALVFGFIGFGYDVTDEGYYLASIAHHAEFPVSSTQFGFIYHPLFHLVGGDIALLRAASLAITVSLGVWLTHVVLSCRLPTSIAIGVTSVTVINGWLVSPSYNSLTIQALLLAAVGLASSFHHSKSNWPPVLIGLAGWIAFMAKPPSAAALAVLTLICLALGSSRRVLPLLIAVSVAGTALLASALLIDGSPSALLDRLRAAVEDGRILQGVTPVEGIFRFDAWPLQWKDKALLMAVSVIVAVSTALLGSSARQRQQAVLLALAGAAILAAAAMIIFTSQLWPYLAGRQIVWRILFFVTAAAGIGGATYARWGTICATVDRKDRAMISFLGALPFAAAFGSNVNYWILSGCASIFWTLAAMRFVVVTSGTLARLPMTIVAQANCLLLVSIWVTHPYRQSQALFDQNNIVPIGSGTLRMSSDGANYLNTLIAQARRTGFREGEPLLDLTGHSPGVAFALGARPVGDAWVVGGYVGSQDFARRILFRTPCAVIGRAWLLIEPGSPRALEPASLGLSPLAFRVVTRLQSPATDYPAGSVQILMRPVGKIAERVAACERTRLVDFRENVK